MLVQPQWFPDFHKTTHGPESVIVSGYLGTREEQ